jgi:short-subunit dehydrogenase
MKKALITGASGGIGKAIAEELAKRKVDLLLVARSEDKLRQLAQQLTDQYKIKATVLPKDLSLADSPQQIFDYCQKENFDLDVLINNAGYGVWGNFHEKTLEEQLTMMHVNMDALVKLTYLMIPVLRRHSKSYLLNVSSTTAFQAIPTFALYAASKSFVLSFTRAIRHELKDTGIRVTCLVPGATDTDFVSRAGLDHIADKAKKFSMSSEAVAKIAIAGMLANKAEVIPGLMNIISAKATNILPKTMIEKIASKIYE